MNFLISLKRLIIVYHTVNQYSEKLASTNAELLIKQHVSQ